jgi:beta-lactamase regulating signal transducer with metallopeptidase domain/uncharacterized membrane protein YkoI
MKLKEANNMMTTIEFGMTFLLNAIWQSALVVMATIIAARILRRVSAVYQYRLWVAAIVLSLVLPVATSLLSSRLALFNTHVTPTVSREVAIRERSSPLTTEPPLPENGATASRFPLTVPFWLAIAISVAYILLIAYRSTVLLRAWLRSRAIVSGARHAELPKNIVEIIEQCSKMLDEQPPDLLFSDQIPVPVTFGNRRPVVILPEQFLAESNRDVLLTAVGHEMVHIARRDYIVNLILEIVCVPLSFHPAIVHAKRRMNHMRELCCDETVATRLINAEAYVRSLLNIAGSAVNTRHLSPIITVGITDAENLEVRIMSLLKRSEMSVYKKSFLGVAALLLLAVPLVVAGFFSSDVNVDRASALPQARPTVPDEEKEKKEALDRHRALERKLMEIKNALADPNLPEDKKASLREQAEKLEHESESVGYSYRSEREEQITNIKRAFEELEKNASSMDPNEVQARKEKLKSELARLVGEEKADREGNERREEAERFEKEKLASMARVPMEQAIAIAQGTHPGKLVEKGIFLRGDEVAYRIFIRETPEPTDGSITIVIVSAIDGRIIKTEKTFEREEPR